MSGLELPKFRRTPTMHTRTPGGQFSTPLLLGAGALTHVGRSCTKGVITCKLIDVIRSLGSVYITSMIWSLIESSRPLDCGCTPWLHSLVRRFCRHVCNVSRQEKHAMNERCRRCGRAAVLLTTMSPCSSCSQVLPASARQLPVVLGSVLGPCGVR